MLVLAILLSVLGPLYAPVRAVRTGPVQVVPTTASAEYEGPCAEWGALAIEAGWQPDQWPRLSDVMWCESRCDPGAHNRSGASGLLQIMPFWWKGRDAFDPFVNLSMGAEIYAIQGWRAWSCA